MLQLFPFASLTWRESVVGFQPAEMTYMQIEHNWVSASMPGYGGNGAGYAMGENLGSVRWRMTDANLDGALVRTLRSESFERKTETRVVEEITVDVATNRIVQQVEQLAGPQGRSRSVCTFFWDRVENRRTDSDGRTITIEMYPGDGMLSVQRRFERMGTGPKEFTIVDGLHSTFRKAKVELAGRFRGNWGPDRYDGNAYRFTCDGTEQTFMLTRQGELVKVEFAPEYSLALMGQTASRRKIG